MCSDYCFRYFKSSVDKPLVMNQPLVWIWCWSNWYNLNLLKIDFQISDLTQSLLRVPWVPEIFRGEHRKKPLAPRVYCATRGQILALDPIYSYKISLRSARTKNKIFLSFIWILGEAQKVSELDLLCDIGHILKVVLSLLQWYQVKVIFVNPWFG